MNQNDFKNNSEVLAECTENAEYPLEVVDYVSPEILPDETAHFVDTTNCSVVEIVPDNNDYPVRELTQEEATHIALDADFAGAENVEQEFMVFAADGTLLRHDIGEQILEAELLPIVTDNDTVYDDILGEVELPRNLNEEHTFAINALAVEPRNAIPTLNVSTTGWRDISANGWTSSTINVTSNTVWTISRSAAWLTPSIALGNWQGNRGFTVRVDANPHALDRDGTITISGSGVTPRTITFIQIGVPNLAVSVGGWSNIPASGWTSGTINVTSNVAWNITSSANWIIPSLNPGNWFGNRSFTVRIEPSPHALARDGTVTISGSGMTRRISFVQLGAPNLTVSAGGWSNISANGWTSGTINVTSNLTWNLSRSANWLHPSLGLGNWFGNRSFTVRVDPSPHALARDGTVTVSGNGITRRISFVQLGAPNLTVSAGGWSSISANGWTSPTINVTSNLTWNLSRNVNWLHPSLGLGNWFSNRSFTVRVDSNPDTWARSGTVTISGNGMARNISFAQLASPPTRTVIFNANGGTVNPTSRSVTHGNQIGAMPIPTRPNHTFIGWFNTSSTIIGNEITSTFVVTGDLTLWARWRTNAPVIQSPLTGVTVPRSDLTVRWNLVTGATYNIQMRNLITNQLVLPAVHISAGTSQFTIPSSALSAGDRHRIAVSSVTTNAVNGWSEVEFNVEGFLTPAPRRRIFIDPGHGGNDPGAVGNGMRESDITLDVSLRLAQILRDRGFDVMLSRETDITIGVDPRWQMANNWNADYFVSVHVNSAEGTGFETIIPTQSPNNPSRDLQANRRLAETVSNTLGRTFGMAVRRANGVMLETETRHPFVGVLRNTRMLAILPELGFIDAPAGSLDINLLRNRRPELANALANGLQNFIG